MVFNKLSLLGHGMTASRMLEPTWSKCMHLKETYYWVDATYPDTVVFANRVKPELDFARQKKVSILIVT